MQEQVEQTVLLPCTVPISGGKAFFPDWASNCQLSAVTIASLLMDGSSTCREWLLGLSLLSSKYCIIILFWNSLPTLHPHCCHQWSECHCPHAGCCLTCFSELSQLTPPNLFAATRRFAHALLLFQHNAQMLLACNYSHIMLSIIDSRLMAVRALVWSLGAENPTELGIR